MQDKIKIRSQDFLSVGVLGAHRCGTSLWLEYSVAAFPPPTPFQKNHFLYQSPITKHDERDQTESV